MPEEPPKPRTTAIPLEKRHPLNVYVGPFAIELGFGVGEAEKHQVTYRQNVLGFETLAVDGAPARRTFRPRWSIRWSQDVGGGERHAVRVERSMMNRIAIDVDGTRLFQDTFSALRFFQASLGLTLLAIGVLLGFLSWRPFHAPPGPDTPPKNADWVSFCEKARRQGVLIHALDRGSRVDVLGSGVVIQRVGETCFVLTAKHVVEGFLEYRLPVLRLYEGWTGDWAQFSRETGRKSITERFSPILYRDPQRDLAILAMREPTGKAVPAEVTAPKPTQGAWVFAMGNPGRGAVFQDRGTILDIVGEAEKTSIVHDAVIEHGSSGGPLYNRDFALVGINVKRWPPGRAPVSGPPRELAAAVPVNELLDRVTMGAVDVPAAARDAASNGRVAWAWMDCGVDVRAGQTVHASARGWWIVDERTSIETVRRCDAGGFSDKGRDYMRERLFAPHPLGCLLLGVKGPADAEPEMLGTFDDSRTETAVVDTGGLRTSRFKIPRDGRLVARVNDREAESNGGFIELAVVVAP